MREHVFHGALYHGFVLVGNWNYPRFRPHRKLNVAQEFTLYIRRMLLMPLQAPERRIATPRIRLGSFPYHLALLQLEHDSSFEAHGPFRSQSEFLTHIIEGFAAGAPPHHHLVFKAHPLDDGRAPIRRNIRRFSRQQDEQKRVHFIRGGKLTGLLTEERSPVTVYSTAGQQELWRGIPLCAFGAAVYTKPELVSDQPLHRFFAAPSRPDVEAYRHFRDFLLATSQLPGSFYARRGRRQVIRRVTGMKLEGGDPYEIARSGSEAHAQQLRTVQ